MIKIIKLLAATACVTAMASALNAAGQPLQNAHRPLLPLAPPPLAEGGDKTIDASRAAAIRECSALAERFRQDVWGVTEIAVYRDCMAQRGQVE